MPSHRALAYFVLGALLGGAPAAAGAPGSPVAAQEVKLRVTDDGFVPASQKVRANRPVRLSVTRLTDETCATELLIPEENVRLTLPLNETVQVTFTPKKAGRLVYGCAMGMMVSGVLVVEPSAP